MADRQPRIPEHGEEAGKLGFESVLCGSIGEDQQIDVRLGEQFATAIATYREQGQGRAIGNATRPGFLQQVVGRARAQGSQPAHFIALVKPLGQAGVGRIERGLGLQ